MRASRISVVVSFILAAVWSLSTVQAQRTDVLEATGMKVTGYADRISVQPGEVVRFMISSNQARYRLDLVRLIHGDESPTGPGFKEEVIDTPINAEYPGRLQSWDSGSYAVVPDHEALRLSGSFTLQAWIYPTIPQRGVQGLLTKWSVTAGGGYALVIDEDGSLGLWLSDTQGNVTKVRTEKPFRVTLPINGSFQDDNWYFVAAVYDAVASKVTLYQEPLKEWPGETRVVVEKPVTLSALRRNTVPFLIAGYWDAPGALPPAVEANFNGKIDGPRVFRRALDREAIHALGQGSTPADAGRYLVAAWDFSRELMTSRILDLSKNGLHGKTVNRPGRAVTGHNWSGREINFKHASSEYGAIYFHDDDLEDAGWQAQVQWQVPLAVKSGFYAARLRAGDAEDYVPFFVRPKQGTKSSSIAFLVPTFTYLAYANIGNGCAGCGRARSLGLYGRHSDRTGVYYSSTLRPILDMRPKAVTRWGAGGSTPRHYGGDLYLINWLEAKAFQYDVITDHDLHAEGKGLLSSYRVVMTGSHPEYFSGQMRDSVQGYLQEGGRLMYLGGNGFYWITSVAPDNPHVIEVRRWGGTQGYEAAPGEWYHSTTGELGGLWRFRGRPPQKLVGIGFTGQGFDKYSVYKRESGSSDPAAAFIFEGVDSALIGDFPSSAGMGRGAAGDELDRLDTSLGSPPHTLLLARARDFSDAYQLVVEEVMENGRPLGGTVNERVRADMVYFKYPKDGAVFSAGSIGWFGALSFNNYDNNVSRIMENVLKRFSAAGPLP
jgi:N,N-dimethylformamidase